MRSGERVEEVKINVLVMDEADQELATAVTAAYSGGHAADMLFDEAIDGDEEGELILPLVFGGETIIGGLRLAAAGVPVPEVRAHLFPLTDEQREQARQIVKQFDKERD